MSVGRTYKFFGFSISYTILNLSLSTLWLPIMLLIPCTFFPITPLPFPADNPPCDLHFCDYVPVLVVCLVCFCVFRFGCWELWVCCHFTVHSFLSSSFSWISSFNISYNKGLVMTNSFNLTLSGKHFICPSILNDSFAGESNLGCRSLPFMTSDTPFQPLLACKVSFEKSADSLMGTPLEVSLSLSLAAFKILSLCLILSNLMMMCLGVFLLGSSFFGTLWASWTSWKSISFARLEKFSFVIFSK